MFNSKEPVTILNNKLKSYLVGSMESPADGDDGIGWRRELTPSLNDRGIYCFDPTKEETQKVGMSTSDLMGKLNGWQLGGHWGKFTEYMGKIWKGVSELEEDPVTKEPRMIHIMGDIDYVENSDFLIWYLKDGDKLGGTIAELTIAWYRGIPCYLVTSVPKSQINKSILYFLLDSGHGSGKIFSNFTSLLGFLDGQYNLSEKEN